MLLLTTGVSAQKVASNPSESSSTYLHNALQDLYTHITGAYFRLYHFRRRLQQQVALQRRKLLRLVHQRQQRWWRY